MIDLLTEVEKQISENIVNALFDKFSKLYPNVMIGRPSRFCDTVKRKAAPTIPSLIGPSKLSGSPLVSYRKRIWIPKVQQQGSYVMKVYMQQCIMRTVALATASQRVTTI